MSNVINLGSYRGMVWWGRQSDKASTCISWVVANVLDLRCFNIKRLKQQLCWFFCIEEAKIDITLHAEWDFSLNMRGSTYFFWNFIDNNWALVVDLWALKHKILEHLTSNISLTDISSIYREWDIIKIYIRGNIWGAFTFSLQAWNPK